MKVEPLIVVNNVEKSSEFYQQLLGCESAHGGDEYEMLTLDGKLVLQLHHKDAHEHPGMWVEGVKPGNGVILWFRTETFDEHAEKAKKLSPAIVRKPHVNQNAMQYEIWFRDPDGYLVVISSHMGDAQ